MKKQITTQSGTEAVFGMYQTSIRSSVKWKRTSYHFWIAINVSANRVNLKCYNHNLTLTSVRLERVASTWLCSILRSYVLVASEESCLKKSLTVDPHTGHLNLLLSILETLLRWYSSEGNLQIKQIYLTCLTYLSRSCAFSS